MHEESVEFVPLPLGVDCRIRPFGSGFLASSFVASATLRPVFCCATTVPFDEQLVNILICSC